MKDTTLAAGIFSTISSLAALCIYMWGFGNRPVTIESLFWAMPLVSPLAFLVYFKFKRVGAVLQLILYSLATIGAIRMEQADCARPGSCSNLNPLLDLLAGMLSDFHMIAMLAALVLMCIGVAKTFRSPQPA